MEVYYFPGLAAEVLLNKIGLAHYSAFQVNSFSKVSVGDTASQFTMMQCSTAEGWLYFHAQRLRLRLRLRGGLNLWLKQILMSPGSSQKT